MVIKISRQNYTKIPKIATIHSQKQTTSYQNDSMLGHGRIFAMTKSVGTARGPKAARSPHLFLCCPFGSMTGSVNSQHYIDERGDVVNINQLVAIHVGTDGADAGVVA